MGAGQGRGPPDQGGHGSAEARGHEVRGPAYRGVATPAGTARGSQAHRAGRTRHGTHLGAPAFARLIGGRHDAANGCARTRRPPETCAPGQLQPFATASRQSILSFFRLSFRRTEAHFARMGSHSQPARAAGTCPRAPGLRTGRRHSWIPSGSAEPYSHALSRAGQAGERGAPWCGEDGPKQTARARPPEALRRPGTWPFNVFQVAATHGAALPESFDRHIRSPKASPTGACRFPVSNGVSPRAARSVGLPLVNAPQDGARDRRPSGGRRADARPCPPSPVLCSRGRTRLRARRAEQRLPVPHQSAERPRRQAPSPMRGRP